MDSRPASALGLYTSGSCLTVHIPSFGSLRAVNDETTPFNIATVEEAVEYRDKLRKPPDKLEKSDQLIETKDTSMETFLHLHNRKNVKRFPVRHF